MTNIYIDTISGETLYVHRHPRGWTDYSLDKEGKISHRVDGPAQVNDIGVLHWVQNGKAHRLDGPSSIYPTGHRTWNIEGEVICNTVINTSSGEPTEYDLPPDEFTKAAATHRLKAFK